MTEYLANASVKALTAQRVQDLGTIEGTLVSISLARQTPQFSVREPVHGRLIPCTFSIDDLEKVRDALMKRFAVRGHFTHADDGLPARLSGIDDFAVLDDPPDFDPSAFFGLDPDFTDGIPASEFVNRGWRDREE